jgi:hypothetical protein
MEMLSIEEIHWDENHYLSSFLPSLDKIEEDIHYISPPPLDVVNCPQSPILTQDTTSEGNLVNISSTITIDILIK